MSSNKKAHTAIAVTRSPYRATSLIERLRAAMSGLSYLLLLIVAYSSPATAQHPEQNGPRSLNYGFVSPNTRDDLQLSDAIKGMNSTEESELLKHAAALSCVVRSNVRASKAVGSWTDGAENSVLVRVKTDELTIRYLMSRLGREANQKAILYFHPASNGTTKLIILDPQPRFRKLTTLARTLDAAGIAFRTLVPSRRNTRVYIVDTEGNLSPKLKLAARRLHARVTLQMGNASFIGDGSVRENGQNIFANEMKDYETKHPGLPTACKNQ